MRLASSVSLPELAELPLISIGEGTRQFESHLAFASAGLNPASVFQTNQPQTLLSLVRHGLGTGVTNALAVTRANLDGVRLAPTRTPALDRVVETLRAVAPPTWPGH